MPPVYRKQFPRAQSYLRFEGGTGVAAMFGSSHTVPEEVYTWSPRDSQTNSGVGFHFGRFGGAHHILPPLKLVGD